MPLTLQYAVTRTFKPRWFAPISLAGAFVVILFLTIINIPLTGYETVTTFQSDFNATDPHWFDGLMPFRIPKPGSTCDAHLFKVGDALTTNYSFFEWDIDSIIKPNTGRASISYTGTPLTFCDISTVYLTGDLHTWNIDFVVIVTCRDPGFSLTAKTSFSKSFLPGRYSPVLGTLGLDVLGYILDAGIQTASEDLGGRAFTALLRSNYTTPMIYSLQADFVACPVALGNDTPCAMSPPQFNITFASTVYANSTIHQYPINGTGPDANPWVLDDDTEQPIFNLLQMIHAAIQIDLGHSSPNNFILNSSAVNETITSIFPATRWNNDLISQISMLYYGWTHPTADVQAALPIKIYGPAHIELVYPCRFQRRKSTGSLIVSVLVATLSMFSSGWALFILIATVLIKRADSNANRCDGHCSRHRTSVEPTSWFDADDTYSLRMIEPPTLRKDNLYQPLSS